MYKLITTKEGIIIVDTEAKIKLNDWYIDDVLFIRQSITDDKDYWYKRKDYHKVIAGNIHPLQEFPLISNIFEELHQMYQDAVAEKKAYEKIPEMLRRESGMPDYDANIYKREIWIKGYKSNPNQFTKEQMEEAIKMARLNRGNMYSNEQIFQSLQVIPECQVEISEIIDNKVIIKKIIL